MSADERIQRLVNAGIITVDPSQLTAEMRQRLGSLSDDEVTHLISVKAQLGDQHIAENRAGIAF